METPTEAVVRSSQPKEETIKDGDIAITVRVLSPVEQFRFKKVVGKYIDNPGYMIDAMMAASVRVIDGRPMPMPETEADVEFILEELGWGGWQAVQIHYTALSEDGADKVAIAKN